MIKRIFDISVSFIAIVILLPVFLVLSILVYINMGSPVFFIQERIGKNNKRFNMIKFRTMINDNSLTDEQRLTKFGKFLRSSSLDELPELINILKGDMSIVGPRPLLVQYLPLYNEFQIRRHEVRPGLTGLAQVNGRNNLSWDDRFNMDVYYVDNSSLIFDIKIILRTILKVFKREGTHVVPPFEGNKEEI